LERANRKTLEQHFDTRQALSLAELSRQASAQQALS